MCKEIKNQTSESFLVEKIAVDCRLNPDETAFDMWYVLPKR